MRVTAALAACRVSRSSRIGSAALGAALVLGAACGGGFGGGGPAPPDVSAGLGGAPRPNVVWMVADAIEESLAVESLGGARTAVAEVAAVSSDPASARAALLTGMRPETLGLDAETGRLAIPPPAGTKVLPEQLRRAGYYTSRAGPPRHNLASRHAEPVRVVHVDGGVHQAARALPAPLDDLAQPGLLGAWDAAGPDADWRGRDRDWESPCTVSFGCGGARSPGSRPFFALFNLDDRGHGGGETLEEQVARTIAALAADGLLEDTVVFLIGAAGATPTVAVRWPARIAGAVGLAAPASLLDPAPTALALAGVTAPEYMEGQALVGPVANALPATPAARVATEGGTGRALGAASSAPVSTTTSVPAPPVAHGSVPAAASAPVPTGVPVVATPGGYPTGGLFHVAPRVDLGCETEGSTIVYTTEREAPFYWRLYTGPFRMRFWTLRFQCGRLGYRDSDVVTFDFDIE